MKKVLFYGMSGEKRCFMHVLLNVAQLNENGVEVKLIFEGASVKLVPVFEEENNPVYRKIKDAGLIAGVVVLAWALDSSPAEADTQAQAQARQELRRDLAAQRACAAGETVVWLDERTMACRREVQP